FDSPRVAVLIAFLDQDRHAAIDAESDLSIATRAENRTGAGVRIQQPDLIRCQGESLFLVAPLSRIVQEEGELGLIHAASASRHPEQAELVAPVYLSENPLRVLEVIERDQ